MKALLVIDIQNDFLSGGALAVPDGDEIIPLVNDLMAKFDRVIATQDWHPSDHGSFAINHPGYNPGDIMKLNGLDQILWPQHCVQNSYGAEFSKDLDITKFEKIFRKGTDPGIDSYSGFFDNGHLKSTGLGDYLKREGISDLYIVGLATDYCVKFTAIDALNLGFNTSVIWEATRAVNLQHDDFDMAIADMASIGIEIIGIQDVIY